MKTTIVYLSVLLSLIGLSSCLDDPKPSQNNQASSEICFFEGINIKNHIL